MQNYKIVSFILMIICLSIQINAQDEINFPKGEKGYEQLYQKNIKKSRINGVYIPADLEEAFQELDDLSPEEAKLKFKNAPEEVVARKLHFGLGRWMYVFWNFEEGSRYTEFLRNLGLTDPDHWIEFTIVSYHRYKNNRPIDQEVQIERFKKKREAYLKSLKERREVIHTETRKIPKDK